MFIVVERKIQSNKDNEKEIMTMRIRKENLSTVLPLSLFTGRQLKYTTLENASTEKPDYSLLFYTTVLFSGLAHSSTE